MTLIDLGDFKLRFDPKEVRINIDGEMIDIGARRNDENTINTEKMMLNDGRGVTREYSQKELQDIFDKITAARDFIRETEQQSKLRRK